MAHTPGPWTFKQADNYGDPREELPVDWNGGEFCYGGNPAIFGPNDEKVVGNDEYNVFAGPKQADNVRLLLAAPDLLEALEDMVQWQMDSMAGKPTKGYPGTKAMQAISKAKGDSHE